MTRVDVVTGGASAVYGSDALTGVVNFVLDKKFTGTKFTASGGATNYGDDPNWKVGLTEGFGFADDRGHFIVSGEIARDYGIRGVPRDWNNGGAAIINNPAYAPGNGQPQLIRVDQAALYVATAGGIITDPPTGPKNPSPTRRSDRAARRRRSIWGRSSRTRTRWVATGLPIPRTRFSR